MMEGLFFAREIGMPLNTHLTFTGAGRWRVTILMESYSRDFATFSINGFVVNTVYRSPVSGCVNVTAINARDNSLRWSIPIYCSTSLLGSVLQHARTTTS